LQGNYTLRIIRQVDETSCGKIRESKLKVKIDIPRIVIGGTHSNVGKTTLVCAIARHFKNCGKKVRIFKCGPDYLDPTYHQRASGISSVNLDSWMMGKDAVKSTFYNATIGYDLAIIEGVMGLFDGVSPTSETGSTAEIAKVLGAPVILVCDSSGMSRSIAALASGFKNFDPDLNFSGVICNRVGSLRHFQLLKDALGDIPTFGGLGKGDQLFPGRHLGLTTASRDLVPEELFDYWEKKASEMIDFDSILKTANDFVPIEIIKDQKPIEKTNCKIAYAKDAAFHFYYEENLNLLKSYGAELIPFSPLEDAKIPEGADGILIGGGYPEIHGEKLSNNKSMKESIIKFAQKGGPIYGECGGLMYLTMGIQTSEGTYFEMLGLLPGKAVMEKKLKALGYVEVETKKPTVLGPKGMRFRGHQFRYSTLVEDENTELSYSLRKRRNREVTKEGYINKNILGSYVHAHWGSNKKLPESFVKNCVLFKEGNLGQI